MPTTKRPEKTTAVALSGALGQAMAMANELAKSKIVPLAYASNPSGVFAAMQYGKELGISPMLSLSNIAVINGKASLGADMELAIAMKHPEWAGYEILEETASRAKVVVYRKVKAQDNKIFKYYGEFTMEEARSAGLVSTGGAWQKWPKQMLLHRATAFAVRKAFPDKLPKVYTEDELNPKYDETPVVMAEAEVDAAILEEQQVPVEPIIVPKAQRVKKPTAKEVTAKRKAW